MSLLKEFWYEEDGVGVVEIILILVVLIGLALIFRSAITDIVNSIITKIQEDAEVFTE